MRAWPILGVALLGAGCFTNVLSLQPLCTEETTVALPGIAGAWATEGDDPTVLRFVARGDKSYQMFVTEDGKEGPGSFVVSFTSIGEHLYWNLVAEPLEDEADLWKAHRLPVHGLARIVLDEDRLDVAFLDPDWLRKASEEGRLDAAHTVVDGVWVLTGTTEDLRGMVAECNDEEAFVEAEAFTRQARK